MATAGAVAASSISASSYRVKFRRAEFLELADIAKPSIIYHRGRMHFFAYDGFVMYTFECKAGISHKKYYTRWNSATISGANNV